MNNNTDRLIFNKSNEALKHGRKILPRFGASLFCLKKRTACDENSGADQDVPDSPRPDIYEPNDHESDTQNPDTQEPNAQEPNAQEPNTHKPNAQKPNAQKPDTQKPDTPKRRFDFILYFSVVILATIGIFAVFSALVNTKTDVSVYKIFIQIAAFAVGLLCMTVLPFIDYRLFLKKYVMIVLYSVTMLLMILTALFGAGDGNRSWLWIGFNGIGMGFQPSEFAKLSMILLSAGICRTALWQPDGISELNGSPNGSQGSLQGEKTIYKFGLKNISAFFIVGLSLMASVALQRDVGTLIVFYVIFVSMLFLSKIKRRWFAAFVSATAALSPVIWYLLREYQKKRIIYGFYPEGDPLGYGYQALMSREAVFAGGLLGKGYMNGEISPFVPANYTDMILSVIGEEFGIVGMTVILLLFGVLFWRGIAAAVRSFKSGNVPGGVIVCGVCVMIFIQMAENAGMSFGVLPVIGITLPFLSYGGSSLLSLMISAGVVLSVERHS